MLYISIYYIKKRNNIKCFIFRYTRNNNYKEKNIYENDLYKQCQVALNSIWSHINKIK